MNVATLERLLVLAGVGLIAIAAARWRAASIPPPSIDIVPPALHRRAVTMLLDEDSLAAAADLVTSGDPFRVANAPTSVAFSPRTEGGQPAEATPPRAPHPLLVLRAIVGGPPWQAIVDGIPGQPPGTIVNTGMVISDLRIRAVLRDTVVVQGSDTTWKLTLGGGRP
jgi:hypothetical protein